MAQDHSDDAEGRLCEDGVEPEALFEDDADDAVAAFYALRDRLEILHADLTREMTTIRKGVEYALDQADQRGIPVDYSTEMGRNNQELASLNERLQGIEQSPALRYGPDHYARMMERSGESLVRAAAQQFQNESRDFQRAARELADHVASARERRQQNQWVLVACLGGLLAGIALVMFLPRMLSPSLATHVAAIVMGEDRINAGRTLIEATDPAVAKAVTTGTWVYETNREAIDTCIEQMLEKGQQQRCVLMVPTVQRTSAD
jgi:hypothetical protein